MDSVTFTVFNNSSLNHNRS